MERIMNNNNKRNMDINGNDGHNNKSQYIPTYVERKRGGTKPSENYETNDTENLVDDYEPSCYGIKWGNRYNPTVFNCIAYFGAAACLLLMINIPVLPDIYYPTIGNLLPRNMQNPKMERVMVVVVLWGLHFVRRFAEVLFVHIYRRGMKLIESIGAIIYYCFFGVWMGWSISFSIGYLTPPDIFFIPGILICFGGGIGNIICHLYLREMSLQRYRAHTYTSESHHVMPHRCCFKLIACPHYLFEIITWLGFALATFTLAAWTFLLVTFIVLVIYSRQRHLAYIREFDGKNGREKYPTNRKALIPFVL